MNNWSSSADTKLIITENPPLWRWLKLLTGSQFIFFMGPLLSSLLGNHIIMVFVNFSAIIVALYSVISWFPTLLYSMD